MGQRLRNNIGTRVHGRPWRRLAVVLALVGSLALALAGFTVAAGLSVFPVALGPSGPSPGTITVNWGDTVMFVNNDTVPHGITSSRPELVAPTIAPGATFTTILTGRTATYPYRQTGSRNPPKGSVVSSITGTVTLKSSKAQILYGQSVQLSGTASISNTAVSVQERLHGKRGWKQILSLSSDASGGFSAAYKPKQGAKYRTTIAGGQIFSQLVTVNVKPTLTISSQAKKTKANHKVTIASRITPSGAASELTLLACNQYRGSWLRVGSKRPSSSGGATFYYAVPVGKNYLKTTVTRADSAVGYVVPTSGTITVTALGKAPKKQKHTPKSC